MIGLELLSHSNHMRQAPYHLSTGRVQHDAKHQLPIWPQATGFEIRMRFHPYPGARYDSGSASDSSDEVSQLPSL